MYTQINPSPTTSNTTLRFRLALMVLFALFAFFLILTPILTSLLARVIDKPLAVLRISMILQDILVFMVPPIAAAMLATRLPARLLALDHGVKPQWILMGIGGLLLSAPMMNVIVEWNQSVHLPDAMSHIETVLRQMEDAAAAMIDSLMVGASVGSVIVSVLIIGVMAGLSEELFFRGGLQRLFVASGMRGHTAIWLTAFLFSLLHFQFFGFVPRLLLGAYFGYLLWWSRSVWLPIIVHILNNTIVVITTWRQANGEPSTDINSLGTDFQSPLTYVLLTLSLILTVWLLYAMHKQSTKTPS